MNLSVRACGFKALLERGLGFGLQDFDRFAILFCAVRILVGNLG